MKIKAPFLLLVLLGLWACEDDALPTVSNDTLLKDKLKGTWVPVSLEMKYQVGITPNQRDTTVRLTPTTTPLLVAGRTNPVMPFTDTLYFNARTSAIDTFYLMNRGVRQQANFSVVTSSGSEGAATLLRIARPTYTRGQITRWNYDFTFHGNVTLGTNNQPSYAVSTYTNYSPSIRSVSESQLVLSFTSQANVNNLPQLPITPANQNSNTAWGGRIVWFTATYQKR